MRNFEESTRGDCCLSFADLTSSNSEWLPIDLLQIVFVSLLMHPFCAEAAYTGSLLLV